MVSWLFLTDKHNVSEYLCFFNLRDFVWVVEIRRGLDPYKALLCSGTYHSVSFNFVFFLVNGTWLREDQTPVILIGCELELVVLMRNAHISSS